MPWNDQSGGGRGPWGNGGGGGQNPWGQRPGGGRPGGGGSGGGGQPPDFEAMLRQGQNRMKSMFPGGLGAPKVIALGVAVIVGLWLLSGFYRVNEGERGVELLFGQFINTQPPGLAYNPPDPIGEVIKVNVAQINRITIGYNPIATRGGGEGKQDVLDESLMVTRDQNIVDIEFDVNWRIDEQNVDLFLFNVADPESTTKIAAESVMREVIGRTTLDNATTEGRTAIQAEVLSELQRVLEEYGVGVTITNVEIKGADPPSGTVMLDGRQVSVIDAFRDVVAANNDRERRINEATRYANQIIPEAQGDAARLRQEAEAYKQQQIQKATGDAERFNSIYSSYEQSREVTARRLYLETMEEVLRNSAKVIIDENGAGAGGSGVVPYLPLDRLRRDQQVDSEIAPPDNRSSATNRAAVR